MYHLTDIKVSLIGDGGVGKTAFIRGILGAKFTLNYNPTQNFYDNKYKLTIKTNYGLITFNIYDTAGQERYNSMDKYHNVNAIIYMFDLTSSLSYKSIINEWYKDSTIPTVLCGNKVDIEIHKLQSKDINFHHGKSNMIYLEISSKSKYNLEPFLFIAKQITGKSNLVFI